MVTPGTSTWYSIMGSVNDPPPAPPRLKTRKPVPPAQAAFLTEPRMTPMSWHVCSDGSVRSRRAPAGLDSGTSTMSNHGHGWFDELL